MTDIKITRRTFVGGVAGAAGFATVGARAQQLALPTAPVALSIVDVAGNLALTQKAIEAYRRAKPGIVSRFAFTKAPAPELPSKLKAQQAAGRVDIDLVLTGTDGIAAGITSDGPGAVQRAPVAQEPWSPERGVDGDGIDVGAAGGRRQI